MEKRKKTVFVSFASQKGGVGKSTDFDYMYDRIMNDGYLYNWVSEANEINGYSPRLAESCYVYRKDELGVLTVELEYVVRLYLIPEYTS